jgi:hypothetical protein
VARRGEARVTRAALALALLWAGACAKCGGEKPTVLAVPDAGTLVRRSTDLRTAVMTAMPEFRDTRLLHGSAVLRRTVEGEAPTWEADARRGFAANGWAEAPAAAGSKVLVAGKEPFRLEVERRPRGAELRVSLPLRDGDVARILSAPISITTEQLALYFPKLAGTAPVRERFEVTLGYESFAFRTHWLVWQLVDLSTRGAWKLARVPEGFEVGRKSDGGIGEVPARVSLLLEDSATGARVAVDRDGKNVTVEYQLDTLAAP